jgi:hypothetical protein
MKKTRRAFIQKSAVAAGQLNNSNPFSKHLYPNKKNSGRKSNCRSWRF